MTNPIDTSVSSVKMKAKRQSERGTDAIAELNPVTSGNPFPIAATRYEPPDGNPPMVLPPTRISQLAISLCYKVYDLSIQ